MDTQSHVQLENFDGESTVPTKYPTPHPKLPPYVSMSHTLAVISGLFVFLLEDFT